MTQSRPASASVRKYGLAVFIGRFSPPTEAHLWVIEQGLRVADQLLINIGSANAPRRFDLLPFTAPEREQMIRLMLTPEQNRRVHFSHTEDQGNMPKWTTLIRAAANAIQPDNKKITLVGHSKDRSSFYLKAFRGWHSTDVENYKNLSATAFRMPYFSLGFMPQDWPSGLHAEVTNWLVDFRTTQAYQNLFEEAIDVGVTRAKYGTGPFMTGDAVVIHGDHVLMVERAKHPFRGCLAFPGGFVEDDERMLDAIFRELSEETGLKVPEQILRQNLIHTELLDAPFRDPRGRIISLAGLIYLNPTPPASMTDPKEIERYLALPRVTAGDDAKRAFWTPIADVQREQTAFDHFMVLQNMLDQLPSGER